MDERKSAEDIIVEFTMLRAQIDTCVNKIEFLSAELLDMIANQNATFITPVLKRKQVELYNQMAELKKLIVACNNQYLMFLVALKTKESEKDNELREKMLSSKREQDEFQIRATIEREAQSMKVLITTVTNIVKDIIERTDKCIVGYNEINQVLDKRSSKMDEYLEKIDLMMEKAYKNFKAQGMRLVDQISNNQFASINSDTYDTELLRTKILLMREQVEQRKMSPEQMMMELRSLLNDATHPHVRETLLESVLNKKLDDDASQLHRAYLPTLTSIAKGDTLKAKVKNQKIEIEADRIKIDGAIERVGRMKLISDLPEKLRLLEQRGKTPVNGDQILARVQDIQAISVKEEEIVAEWKEKLENGEQGDLDIENELAQVNSIVDAQTQEDRQIHVHVITQGRHPITPLRSEEQKALKVEQVISGEDQPGAVPASKSDSGGSGNAKQNPSIMKNSEIASGVREKNADQFEEKLTEDSFDDLKSELLAVAPKTELDEAEVKQPLSKSKSEASSAPPQAESKQTVSESEPAIQHLESEKDSDQFEEKITEDSFDDLKNELLAAAPKTESSDLDMSVTAEVKQPSLEPNEKDPKEIYHQSEQLSCEKDKQHSSVADSSVYTGDKDKINCEDEEHVDKKMTSMRSDIFGGKYRQPIIFLEQSQESRVTKELSENDLKKKIDSQSTSEQDIKDGTYKNTPRRRH